MILETERQGEEGRGRERDREREIGREKHGCEKETSVRCFPYAPDRESNPQPRYVP